MSRHSEDPGEEPRMPEDCRAVCLLASPVGTVGMRQASDQVGGVSGRKDQYLVKTQ